MTTWMIDNKINLTQAGENANWHRTTIIDNLMAQQLGRRDAEAFADFICNEYVILNDGISDHDSEECVNDEQYERLSV